DLDNWGEAESIELTSNTERSVLQPFRHFVAYIGEQADLRECLAMLPRGLRSLDLHRANQGSCNFTEPLRLAGQQLCFPELTRLCFGYGLHSKTEWQLVHTFPVLRHLRLDVPFEYAAMTAGLTALT